MNTIEKRIDPYEEQLKANLYKTLSRLGLTKSLYMNWNYVVKIPGIYGQAFVGDTRWNQ